MKSFFSFLFFVWSISTAFAQTECSVKIVCGINKSLPPSYTFKVDPQTEGAKYYWSFGDNTISDSPSPTHSFKISGTYKIQVKVTTPDGKGCYGSLQETFEGATSTTTTDCKAYFTAAKSSETAIKKFTFTNYSTGQLRECLWNFGDNTTGTSTATTVTHEYAATGEYKVCLTVATVAGCKADYCTAIKVGTATSTTTTPTTTDCKAYFTVTKASEIAIKKFIFTNYSSGQLRECLWNFGDNTTGTSTATTVTHEYAATGEYKVCLTVATVAGCKADYCTAIKVGTTTSTTTTPTTTDCKAYFTVTKASEIAIKKFTFTNYSSGQLRECLWNFGDNTTGTSTATTVTHEYAAAGEYKVCLTVATVAGCKADYCTAIKVGTTTSTTTTPTTSDCKAYFAAKAGETPSKKFTFTNYSTGQLRECLWNFGDNTASTSTSTTVTHEYANSGEYKVCLTIATVSGCKNYYCTGIKVGNTTSTTTSSGCKFDVVIKPKEGTAKTLLFYAASSAEINTWKWSFGDGSASDAKNPEHTYEKAGVFEIKCTITTATGCTESRTVKYSVLDQSMTSCKGAISLLLFDATDNLCNGKATVKLLNESTAEIANVKYLWSDGQTGSSVGNLCTDKPYTVQAIIEGVCQKSTSFTLLSKPVWRATSFNGSNTFTVVEPKEGIDYKWNFEDGTTLNGSEVNYDFEKDGVYKVTLSAVSGSSISESTQQIIVLKNATGIDVLNKVELKIFPNPAKDVLYLNLGNPVEKDLWIEIYSISGKKVYSQQLSNANYSLIPLNIQTLNQGLYFIKVNDGKQAVYEQKFLKLQ